MDNRDIVRIVYRFHLPQGIREIPLLFDAADFSLLPAREGPAREWARLAFHQCSHCPLSPATTPLCPFADALSGFVESFDDFFSYETADIDVVGPFRTVTGHKPLQHGIASVIGLIGATCGCPHLVFFRPMARFHLPFAHDDETHFRVFSAFLLGQFLANGKVDETDVERLRVLHADASRVNMAMAERLRAALVKDVSVNAIVILDSFAQSVPYVIRDRLAELRAWFGPDAQSRSQVLSTRYNPLPSGHAMTDLFYDDSLIHDILGATKTIALVGASAKPERPSYEVMYFLQNKGYRVIPVNPGLAGKELLGEQVVASLKDIDQPVDMVDVFRASDAVPEIVDDAIAIKAKTVWMQLGVRHDTAAARAEAAGLKVVMNRCPKIELLRLAGQNH